MKKQPEFYLKHMLMAIERIEEYTNGYNISSFKEDPKTCDAVIRQFEIIGEAAGKIPTALTKDSPIAWNNITGLRHRLIHDNMGVDLNVVWKTAGSGVTPLKQWLLSKVG